MFTSSTQTMAFLTILLFAQPQRGANPAVVLTDAVSPAAPGSAGAGTVRVAAVQAKRRTIDFRLKPAEVLAAVEKNLDELEAIVQKAGEEKCDALAFPEDTLGLLNWIDMRARLFRERNPAAFRLLTEVNPPALAKVPIDLTQAEAGRIFARMLTVGEEEFNQAAALARTGKTREAIAVFERLRVEYRGSWIDRVAAERLVELRHK